MRCKMNYYIFEKASNSAIRVIWIESDDSDHKSVANIMEMDFTEDSKESLKNTVKCLYEMVYVGYQNGDENGYSIRAQGEEYDSSLEGKARKQSSKEINVMTEQLWSIM